MDDAQACPDCGYPVADYKKREAIIQNIKHMAPYLPDSCLKFWRAFPMSDLYMVNYAELKFDCKLCDEGIITEEALIKKWRWNLP